VRILEYAPITERFFILHDISFSEEAPSGLLALIGLGSNLGNSGQKILNAMARLQNFSSTPIFKSSLWQTSPVDCPPDSPKFVNAVVGLIPKKNKTPESLLKNLRELEIEFGRAPKTVLNEPRPLDLDLIAFGNEIRNSPELILPHPRAHLRRFVLQPLSEIAPDFILPGHGKTVSQLLAEIYSGEIVTRLDL
jgi:2-amino-4-hydroxy-6-hydroxymethyldihydropteridine diphosphokinase